MGRGPVETYRVGQARDKRRKIPVSEHATIKNLRREGWSWNKLAAKYEVNRRLIMFIVHPERLEAAKRNHDWRNYYDRDKNRLYAAKHRAYKKSLIQAESK